MGWPHVHSTLSSSYVSTPSGPFQTGDSTAAEEKGKILWTWDEDEEEANGYICFLLFSTFLFCSWSLEQGTLLSSSHFILTAAQLSEGTGRRSPIRLHGRVGIWTRASFHTPVWLPNHSTMWAVHADDLHKLALYIPCQFLDYLNRVQGQH